MKAIMTRFMIAIAAAASLCLGANAATELTLNDGDTLTGVYEDYEITIAAGATVTFNGATITHTSGGAPAVNCLGDATIILAPGSVNAVTNTVGGHSCVRPAENATLTLRGSGTLTAAGGDNAAAIGSGQSGTGTCGSIVIEGGTIEAFGGTTGAGIGSGNSGTCGSIVIDGGTVTAQGGDWSAGIGSAYYGTCGDITISSGTVTAEVDRSTSDSSTCTAAIGAGCRGTCGNILISGGTVVADAHSGYSRDDACAIGATYTDSRCGTITITDGITSLTATKGATAKQHIGQGDGSATVGKISSMLRFVKEYSNDDLTLTLTPGSNFETYTVTWKNEDGSTIDTTRVEYGLVPEHADMSKAGDDDYAFLFDGWTPKIDEIVSNTTYTAVFTTIPAEHSTGGDSEWYEADGAWRSGLILHSKNTWAKGIVSRPGVVSFKWKTSSESYDRLYLKVDGKEVDGIGAISGVMADWAEVTLPAFEDSGDHVIEWTYGKDGSSNVGEDCAWVKDFHIEPFDSHTVTLEANYDGCGRVKPRYVKKGGKLDASVIPQPVRQNYVFAGWFTAGEGGEKVADPVDLDGNTTLYAHWAESFDIESTGGNGEWSTEADGITWRSGRIGHGQQTWMRVVTTRPGIVSFKWKTSSESYDRLYLKVDGKDVDGIGSISGVMADWAEVTLPAFEDSGDHVIEWTYGKDGGGVVGEDCAWVTDFLLEPLDSWAVTRNLNYEGAGELETRYVKKGNQLNVSEFPPLDEPREGYTCYWALSPWTGDVLTSAVDISADTTLYAHWIKQYGFDEIDTTCQTPWTWLDDGSIRTGKIGNRGETWATISVTGPCDVSFKWKTSSEANCDKLHFYVDGSEKRAISGVMTEWESYQYTESIAEGDHVLKWTYTKDGSVASGEDCGWIKDIVITASGSAPYTVTWQNADGTVLETDTDLAAGAVPAYNSALPTQAATAQYYYDFAGWEPDFELVSSNAAYTAKYTATLRSYDVTWQDENGTELDAQTLYYGTTPEYAGETPTKAATPKYTYTFAGWDPEVVAVTGEATYTATYDATINEYTITWKNDDGTVIDSADVAYDETPTHADPTKASTAQYHYEFAGWSPAIASVTGEAAYTATFTPVLRSYTITWLNEDGTAFDTSTVEYGATPSHAAPTKASTAQYDYTFAGWGDVVAVTGEATYQATFTPVLRSYTVSWVVEGETVASGLVAYGTVPAYGGVTPTKAETAEYTYTFAGWSPAIASVTGPVTYTAQFNATKRSYTVSWVVEGMTVASGTVEYGQTPTYSGDTPTKTETAEYTYTFSGWSPSVASVTGPATYTAQFEATKRSYTITWANIDGAGASATSTVEYGTTPTYSGDTPTKTETAEYTYEFTGWTPVVAAVTGDATYTAQFSRTKRSYTVSWVVEGETVASGTVEYGATPVYGGDTPAKASTAEYSYEFTGWTPVVAAVTGDATYTAQFSQTKRSYTVSWVVEGMTVASGAVEYGTTPTYTGATPTKESTAEYEYTFTGWSPAVGTVSGDATYTAQFSQTKRSYTVAWVVEGVTVQSGAVEYGATPTYTGATPTKAETDEYTYEFAGWSPAVASVTGNATYTATFNAMPKGEGGTIDVSTLAKGDVVQNGSVLTGTAPNLYLKIADGATITLDGVCITNSASNVSVLHCLGDATIILAPGSENTVVGTVGRYCDGNAIYVPTNSTLTIKGSGALYADSSSSENKSAAIGAFAYPYNDDYVFPCGNIVIEGGTITAKGGVGIGASGNGGYCGDITITGDANVTAIATVNGSAGIGSAGSNGNCGDITISGNASVTATGKYNGPGIGAADHSTCGNIVIATTGTVTATGDYFAPGIGACGAYEPCTCGNITITSGTVIATGGIHAAGIGTDYYYQRSGTCGSITIGDTITMVTAQGMDDSPGIYRPEDSDPYFTYGSNLDLVKSDGNRLYTLTPVVAPDTYTVTWKNDDGTTLETDVGVAYGATPVYDGETPTKAADAQYTYTFEGWTPAVVAATADATYTATFSSALNEYVISWDTDGNGEVDDTTTVAYGTVPTHADGSKAADAQYTYTFTGWDTTPVAVTGAATYTATFNATVNEYTISWDTDGNGEVDDTTTVAYGTVPTHADGSKAATAQYTYTFTGWDTAPVAVTGPATYTATFSETVNEYEISWVVEGVTVASGSVEYGTRPTYNGATPTKPEDENYTYTFNGWTPAVVDVIDNATYTATFTATPKETEDPDEPYNGTETIDGIAWSYTVANGEATITAADPDSGNLVVPDVVEEDVPVVAIDEGAFANCYGLESVTIGSNVVRIGDDVGVKTADWAERLAEEGFDGSSPAFGECESLMNFYVAEGNTVFESIGGALYYRDTPASAKTLALYPSGRDSLDFPEGIVVTKIGDGACAWCNQFTELTIPASVREIGVRSFDFCREIVTLTIPATVTDIGWGAFLMNIALENADINGTDLAIGDYAFYHSFMADNAGNLVIRGGVKDVGFNAFCHSMHLGAVVMEDGVTNIAMNAFSQCYDLSTVTLPDTLTAIGAGAFCGCSELREIIVPLSVDEIGLSQQDDGSDGGAFAGCSGLTRIYLPRSLKPATAEEANAYLANVFNGLGLEDMSAAEIAEILTWYSDPSEIGGDEPEEPVALPDYVTTGGSEKWYVEGNDGVEPGAWRSGGITHYEETWAETTVNGSCIVSFKWKVSSEESFDKLKLLVDDDEKMTISGTKDWKEVILPLSDSGEHTIRWSYAKDSGESRGDDCGWVKDFQVMELVTVPICTGGDAEWFVDPNGNWRSGVIDAYQTTWAETTVTGPCRVNFRWKTSSEEDYNRLTLIVDGTERDAISGVMGDWEAKTLKFQDSRNHVIRWSYSKNTYAYECEDCGWVKGFSVETLPIEDFTFTVEWLDWDGCELETDENVAYGATPEYNGELPERPNDYRYSYSFTGWTPTLTSVTEDATYTAVYLARRLGEETEIIDGIAWSYIVDGDEAMITKASPVTGCLTIPASVSDGITVTAIDDDAFNDCDNLISVVIPEGVERIGERAFYGCAKLESVEFPATVESIGWMAFAYCRKLATVTFNGNIDDIDFDSGVNYTFEGTPWAANIPFKLEMDGTCVVGYSGRMNGKISFADWPAEATSIAEWAFGWEYGLLDVEIPATIVEIGNNAFNGCENITNLVFEAEGEAPLAIGEWAFGNLLKLETVVLPARLASLASGSFGQDEKLADVQFLGEGADVAKDAFVRTPYLLTLDFQMFVDEDGIAYFVQGTPPDDMAASDWPAGLSGIADNLFFCNTNLASVVIPKSVTNVAYQAFYGCTALTNVVFEAVGSGEDALPLAIMDSAFYECANLASVTFREGISSIKDGAFYGCTALATVNFPGGSEDGIDIGDFAFARTAYDASKDFAFIVLSHTVTGFHGTCPAIIRAEDWPVGVVAIASSAFSECSTLEQVTLPTGITDIYWQAFHGCENLGSVNFANSFDTLKTIDREAFSGCTSLETVELDGKDLMIDEGAFEGCTGLTALTIREGVSSIQDFAFSNCRKLEAFVNNSYADIAETAFIGTEYYRNMDFKFIKRLCWEGGWEIVGHKGECPAQINAADWPEDTTVIYRRSFTFDDDLRAVEFPASLRRIDESAFACCTNLVSLTFPQDGSLAIDHNAFALCTKLQNVTLRGDLMVCPDAFAGCSSLETVRVEEGVYELDEGAFARTQVSSIVLPEGMDDVSVHAFAYDDGDFTVYVPRSETSMYGLSNGDVTYEYIPRIFGLETEEGWARYGFVKQATTTDLRVVPYCRVTLDLAGGTGVATSQLGTGETVADQFTHPVKAGFKFDGWTSARVANVGPSTTWTEIIGSATGMEASLTAKWALDTDTPTITPDPEHPEEELVVENVEAESKEKAEEKVKVKPNDALLSAVTAENPEIEAADFVVRYDSYFSKAATSTGEGMFSVRAVLNQSAVFSEHTVGDNAKNSQTLLTAALSDDSYTKATIQSAKPGLYYSMEACADVRFPAASTLKSQPTLAVRNTVQVNKSALPKGDTVFFRIVVSPKP